MHYIHSLRFAFKSPRWAMNLLLVCVCSLIPIVGPIVLIGYFFEMIDSFLGLLKAKRLDGSDEGALNALPVDDYVAETYPNFQFDRFGEYLSRGIWPFLVGFIIHLIVFVLAIIFFIGGMILAGATVAGTPNADLKFAAMYVSFWLVYLSLMLIVGMVTLPIYLHAGLTGEFAAAFSLKFYRDFMQRVGKEVVLSQFFLALVSPPLYLVGALMCYFGMFPAMALLHYAQHHLEYQLYELYLQRGGEPLTRKSEGASPSVDEQRASEYILRPQDEIRASDGIRPEESW